MEAQAVLDFWFKECSPKDWFEANAALDARVRERFMDTYAAVVNGETEAQWRTKPEGRLAEVIVLDQFSRNMFRGTPQAFAHDPLALALAQAAVRAGDDTMLADVQKPFVYLPFMHSESLKVQERSLALFGALGAEESLKYAKEHHAVIERFGRFPHRNAILGRTSTPEEIEFLKTHSGW